jgi:hypothetical protein
MNEWQVIDFPDPIIPSRDITVSKSLPKQTAFDEISFWVREQGVAIGDQLINEVSTHLLELWKSIPGGKDCIFFKKMGYMRWPQYQYQ